MQDITESTSSIHSFLNLSRVLHPIVEAAMARKYSIGNYSLTERTIVMRYAITRPSTLDIRGDLFNSLADKE